MLHTKGFLWSTLPGEPLGTFWLSQYTCVAVCTAVRCMEWLREGQELDAEKRAHMVHRWCTMVGNI